MPSQLHGADRPVHVEELTKTFRTPSGNVRALDRTTFNVADGEFVSLVGPSGCGKSTVLKILAGLIDNYTGHVAVWNKPPSPGRADTAVMLQRPVLLPWRTVINNVMLPTEVLGTNNQETKFKATQLLDLVGLRGYEHHHVWELSGGMQQRVSLARLLISEPTLLLMDEPFSALDEFTRETLNQEIAKLHESLHRSVLYVTHNITEAVFLSDRVIVMEAHPGRVVSVEHISLSRPRTLDSLTHPDLREHTVNIRRALAQGSQEVFFTEQT